MMVIDYRAERLKEIRRKVRKEFDVRAADFQSHQGPSSVSARYAFVTLARGDGYKNGDIGAFLGGKSVKSVSNSFAKATDRALEEPSFARQVADVAFELGISLPEKFPAR